MMTFLHGGAAGREWPGVPYSSINVAVVGHPCSIAWPLTMSSIAAWVAQFMRTTEARAEAIR